MDKIDINKQEINKRRGKHMAYNLTIIMIPLHEQKKKLLDLIHHLAVSIQS